MTKQVVITIPATNVTHGTVIVVVNADGTTKVVGNTKYNNGQITFEAQKNVTYKVVNNSKAFKDVKDTAWYVNAVEYMSAREFITGSQDSFNPNDNINYGAHLGRQSGIDDLFSVFNRAANYLYK